MTTTKHTPGPWKRSHRNICAADGVIVARVLAAEGGFEQESANAHLIADAPERLAVLEALVKYCDDSGYYGDEITTARLSLIKAKGTP